MENVSGKEEKGVEWAITFREGDHMAWSARET